MHLILEIWQYIFKMTDTSARGLLDKMSIISEPLVDISSFLPHIAYGTVSAF